MKRRIAKKIMANPSHYHLHTQHRASDRLGGWWRAGLSKRDLRRIRNWANGRHDRWLGGSFMYSMTPKGIWWCQFDDSPFAFDSTTGDEE